jgi:hypothetical protein
MKISIELDSSGLERNPGVENAGEAYNIKIMDLGVRLSYDRPELKTRATYHLSRFAI